MATKSARKRRSPRKATSQPTSMMRLPVLSPPVLRGVATDALHFHLGASGAACALCLARCRKLGAPFRSACETLCAAVCGK